MTKTDPSFSIVRAFVFSSALMGLLIGAVFAMNQHLPFLPTAESIRTSSDAYLNQVAYRTLVQDTLSFSILFIFLLVIAFAVTQLIATRNELHLARYGKHSWLRWLAGIWSALCGRRGGLHRELTSKPGAEAKSASVTISAAWPELLRFVKPRQIGLLEFAAWLFPVLGFLGTIIGISNSMRDLPGVTTNPQKINDILSSLYVAFDTTFLGLVGSVGTVIFIFLLTASWDAIEEAIAKSGEQKPADGSALKEATVETV